MSCVFFEKDVCKNLCSQAPITRKQQLSVNKHCISHVKYGLVWKSFRISSIVFGIAWMWLTLWVIIAKMSLWIQHKPCVLADGSTVELK